MPPCPPDVQLRHLLDGSLGDADRAGVEDHVNGCEGCQGRLADLTAGDTVALRLRENGSAARRVTPSLVARTFLGRVRAAGGDAGADGPRTLLFAGGPATPPPVVAGYEVGEELGRGGMGVVWKARDTQLNRTVALKMLLNSKYASPEVRLRFLIEAEAVARLQHPGIVQVYEFGDHDGQPYLAMEYVPGGTLAQRLSAGETFAPRAAAALVARLAAAVAAAHRAGVVHRDLKPANILLAGVGDRGSGVGEPEPGPGGGSSVFPMPDTRHPVPVPKVTDFGLAKLDRSDLTRTGALMGTPQYMAPEQAAGRVREVGTPTDVWALGVILYELLTGATPFDAGAPLDVLYQVIHTPPKPPRAAGRRVPRDLETVCLKCLEKDPRKRYPSAADLAADLRAYLDGRTIAARPAGWWERAARFARRNPAPTAAAVVLLAGAVGAFLWVNAARVSEREARRTADRLAAERQAALEQEQAARRDEQAARRAADQERQAAVVARAAAERGEAAAAFDRAVLRCEDGDVEQGVADLARAADLAAAAGAPELARVARANAAAWAARLPVRGDPFDRPDPGREVRRLAFAGGGRWLVAAGSGFRPSRVWEWGPDGPVGPPRDLPTPTATLLTPTPVAFLPGPGDALDVVYQSGMLRRWDLRAGRAVGEDRRVYDRDRETSGAARSPSGDWLAVAGSGGLRVYPADGRPPYDRPHRFAGAKEWTALRRAPGEEPPGGNGSATAVAFGSTGEYVLTAGRAQGVILWETVGGDNARQFEFGGEVFGLERSPDGHHFLAAGETAASLWSIHHRSRPVRVWPHPARVGALAFAPDGRTCATADGGNVRLWDVGTGRPLARFRHPAGVGAVRFAPGGRDLVVGGVDGEVVRWRLPAPPEAAALEVVPRKTTYGSIIPIGASSSQAVADVGYDPADPRRCWAASPNGLKVFAPAGAAWLPYGAPYRPAAAAGAATRTAAVSPDGKRAVVVAWHKRGVRLWDLTAVPPAGAPFPDAVGDPDEVGFLPDGRTAYTVDRGRGVRWWRAAGPEVAPARPDWPLPAVRCLAPHPDGRRVLVGQRAGGRTGFWDLATEQPTGPDLPHPGAVAAVAVDPAGTWAATAGEDGLVRVWSLPDGRPVDRVIRHADKVNRLAFGSGPAAGVLATASDDRTARFWDVRTGLPLGPPLEHPEAVLGVAFRPPGRAGVERPQVMTGGRDGTARFWPVPAAGPE